MDYYHIYSFNELFELNFLQLFNKIFQRIDTDEIIGTVWSKYNEVCKINFNNEVIEFVSQDGGFINKIYSKDIVNINEKIFKVIK